MYRYETLYTLLNTCEVDKILLQNSNFRILLCFNYCVWHELSLKKKKNHGLENADIGLNKLSVDHTAAASGFITTE